MKDSTQDDAVIRMLDQLQGLLKKGRDGVRAGDRWRPEPAEEDERQPIEEGVNVGSERPAVRRGVQDILGGPDGSAQELAVDQPGVDSPPPSDEEFVDLEDTVEMDPVSTAANENMEVVVDAPQPSGVDSEQPDEPVVVPATVDSELDSGEVPVEDMPGIGDALGGTDGLEAEPPSDGDQSEGVHEPVVESSPVSDEMDGEQVFPEAAPQQADVPVIERTGEFAAHDRAEEARLTRRLTARLGQLLLDHQLISKGDLEKALDAHAGSGKHLGEFLVNEGYIGEIDLLQVLAEQHGVPAVALEDAQIAPEVAGLIPGEMARRYSVVPLRTRGDAIDLAIVDPTDFMAMAHIRFATGLRPNVFIASVTATERVIERLYPPDAIDTAAGRPTAGPRGAHAAIKKMILDRDSILIEAEQDPRKFYELAATIDEFVDEILRKASS